MAIYPDIPVMLNKEAYIIHIKSLSDYGLTEKMRLTKKFTAIFTKPKIIIIEKEIRKRKLKKLYDTI